MAGSDSFIPKQINTASSQKAVKTKTRLYLLDYFIGLLFVGALVISVAVLAWNLSIESKLREVSTNINDRKINFPEEKVAEIKETYQTLELVKALLDKQPILSSLFLELENRTHNRVQITGFSIATDDGGTAEDGQVGNHITIAYTGLAGESGSGNNNNRNRNSFNTLIRQSEEMRKSELLRKAAVSNIVYSDPTLAGPGVPPLSYTVSLELPIASLASFTPPSPVTIQTAAPVTSNNSSNTASVDVSNNQNQNQSASAPPFVSQ